MPIFMDKHIIEGVDAKALAEAHAADIRVQGKYGVKFLTYWLDEPRGRGFCLVDAPDAEAVNIVHREAHGEIAGEVMPVDIGTVESFLGAIGETAASEAKFTTDKPPAESAFRTVLFTDIEGSIKMTQRLGDEKAMKLLQWHDGIIRDALAAHNGREVKHTGDGIMCCFAAATQAMECAISIQQAFLEHNEGSPEPPLRLRIGASAGEPVAANDDLFGATVQVAARLCAQAEPEQILVPNVIRELCLGKLIPFEDRGEAQLRGFDDAFHLFEVPWRDAE